MTFLNDIPLRFGFAPALLLFIPAALFLLRWWTGQRGRNALIRYSDTSLMADLPVSSRVRLRRVPDVIRALAWCILVIALARPQSGTSQDIIRGEGINIVVALDISNSMAATDIAEVSRLDASKQVIREFIQGRTFDSIGLVVFGENAYYQSPPTLDYDALLQILDDVPLASELNLGSRTAIGMGVASSVNMLREIDEGAKVVVLLTDGVNNAGEVDPITAANAASTFDIRVYVVRVTVDPYDITETAENELRAVANLSDGRYYVASTFDELRRIYNEIDRLEGVEVEREIFTDWTDRAFPLLILGLVLLIIERILRHTIFQTIP